MPAAPTSNDLLKEELKRQSEVLNREAPLRFVATLLGFCVAAIYLPAWVIVLAMLGDLGGEIVSYLLFRNIDALARDRWRKRTVVAATFVMECSFVLPPGMLWHLDDPYAKALAVGLAAGTMMHIATARSIHLPLSLAGALALLVVLTGSNTSFWIQRGAWTELGVTSLCLIVTIGYFLLAMVSNNRLHSSTAASRLAAQAANAAKGRFLAEMSHELRTPLNGILGMADAELRQASDPASRARLSVLVDSANGLNVLLSDILDLSAMEEGRMSIRPRPLVPADEIASAAALFRPAAEASGRRLILAVDPVLRVPALIDGQRLRQCLNNLLSNAIRHGTGATRIHVAATREEGPAGPALLAVEVEDDGPGLKASALGRTDDPGSMASQGHGLGLSIARGLAIRMGGTVQHLPPSSASGARFRLTIALPPVPAEVVAAPPASSAPQTLQGLQVLVVDDVATNRLVAISQLLHLGAAASEASSGAEALERLAADAVDLVLLDMNMPDMDGLDTFRRIRALPPPRGQVPVVALTADALDHQRAHFLAQGLDGYLTKPISPERIATEVQRVMAARAQRDA
jgi:signal transduction histidine kinase/CheY-like chemotaxis protein